MKSVVIIEDNVNFVKGFEFLINFTDKFKVISVFNSCEDALVEIKALNPDIVLMDVDLPGMSGIEGTRKIKQLIPSVEILVVTVFENSEKVFASLEAGASGYITKNSGTRQILDALEELLMGGAPMSANIARMVVHSFKRKLKPELLTERESEILQFLSIGKSYKTIAAELNISLDTVKFHIKNIYIKLQVSNKEDAIAEARKNNWV
ncbi:response regulator [Sporocytophaga myxococcoides]|uniref:response regulator n=1 Tax=Sporocytophaga myxococcoides TaxID=153721 RepID=UPI00040D5380|nr:response regulator transcription factor [Sporocytophaga myxococcoides]